MPACVLDASALLALLQAEPGWEAAARAVENAIMSTVNLSEVLARLCAGGLPVQAAWESAHVGNLAFVAFSEEQARAAAELRQGTRHAGLSLADRACLALAQARRLPVLTADRAWACLEVGVEIRVIR